MRTGHQEMPRWGHARGNVLGTSLFGAGAAFWPSVAAWRSGCNQAGPCAVASASGWISGPTQVARAGVCDAGLHVQVGPLPGPSSSHPTHCLPEQMDCVCLVTK